LLLLAGVQQLKYKKELTGIQPYYTEPTT